MEAKYKIGDKVWCAVSNTVQKSLPCPECFGKRQLTVILGDDSKIPIPCESCSWSEQSGWGYNEPYPHGYIRYYEHQERAEEVIINRVEITGDKTDYGYSGNYRMDADRVFATKEEAEAKSRELCFEHTEAEIAKIKNKEKPTRTWAWNLHYHRDCIKRAERDLEYHKAKLDVSKYHVKEEKKAEV